MTLAQRGTSPAFKLEVADLSKTYPSPAGTLTILSNVQLSLSAGDAAAIMGPSGTGKSTLLYILGALETPTGGRVTLDGKNPFAMNALEIARFRNSQIGFVFQDHCLLPQCSVLENVLLPTLIEPSEESVTYAKTLIDDVGLAQRMDHKPAQLSGGEKQRVAIARALIKRPNLVVCDEPTGNLDEATADAVTSLLLNLHQKQNNILIVVTHSARLADRFPIRFELSNTHLNRRA